jgi:formylglycine-generating enzyme required for sulfatase activity
MRKPRAVFLLVTFLVVAAFVVLASVALADSVTIDWSPVGNPGNAPDPATGSLYGAVDYSYNIGTYDVTVSQYTAFLNSNDPTGANALGLFDPFYRSDDGYYGINYDSAAANGSKYFVLAGDGNHPVDYVTFYDTLRFANWLNNGQVPGSTETGAYTLMGGTPTPSNSTSIVRNDDATVFLPTANEWYKAAYYNPATSSYYLYPTSSNSAPTAGNPTGLPNYANSSPGGPGNLTDVGAYSGTTSPYGAYDMGGNVFQWNEALVGSSTRQLRGGGFGNSSADMLSSYVLSAPPADGRGTFVGFRVASVATPEPSTGVLAIIACGMILWWRKRFN